VQRYRVISFEDFFTAGFLAAFFGVIVADFFTIVLSGATFFTAVFPDATGFFFASVTGFFFVAAGFTVFFTLVFGSGFTALAIYTSHPAVSPAE
jgi:hypothetical protein